MNKPIIGISRETGEVLTYPGDDQIVEVGKPGSRKDQSKLMPLLATYEHSVMVYDVKGEETRATALWRAYKFGHVIRVVDPYYIVPDHLIPEGSRVSLNPIDFVRQAVSPLIAAEIVGRAFIVPPPRDPHWAENAKHLLSALMLHVAFDSIYPEDTRHMQTVWGLFSDHEKLNEAFARMMTNDSDLFVKGVANVYMEASQDNKEVQGFLSNLRTNCSITFSDPLLMATMLETNIDFATLRDTPTTVYLVLPGDATSILFRYIRMFFEIALSQIERGGLA